MDELLGMRVRDEEGHRGSISAAGEDELRIEWTDEAILRPRVERLAPFDRRARKLEILTLTEGWQPMTTLITEVGSAPRSLIDDLERLLVESSAPLEEASGKSLEKKARAGRQARSKERKKSGGHNPFKTKSRLGPGPRHKTKTKTGAWKCACPSPYKCLCRSGKKRKTIKIKKSYKGPYNKEYKAFRKRQKH
jgi:hypothetical protein